MIKAIAEAGLSQSMYYLFIIVSFIGILIYGLSNARQYSIKVSSAAIMTVVYFVCTTFLNLFLSWVAHGFSSWGAGNSARAFVYIPFLILIFAKRFQKDWAELCDFFAPYPCIVVGFSRIGCIFAGCCRGYICSFGIYNKSVGDLCFPIQIIEFCAAFAIVAFLLHYAKKNHYMCEGKLYPIMMMLFGFSRFFFEFLRNNAKLMFGISEVGFHALFCGIVGAVTFVQLCHREKRIKLNEADAL